MNKDNKYQIHALELGPMENFVYLLHDEASNKAAIVDPAWDVEQVIQIAKAKDIEITDILLTHSHHDHINGIGHVLDQYDAEVHLLKDEARYFATEGGNPTLHHGGDIIKLGESEIKVLHTPGHTAGSACYHIGDDLIAGDTLFVFGCGRCDMTSSDPEQMFDSLKHLRCGLPSHTILHPGHNYAPTDPTSTMEAQKQGNPFLHFDQKEDFVKYRMQVHDKIRDIPYTAVSREEALASLKD